MTKVNEYMKEIEKAYNEVFPNSECIARLSYGMIFIDCYLSANVEECSHRIRENDLFKIRLEIELSEKMTDIIYELPNGKMELVKWASVITRKPDNQYLAFGSEKVSFRKKAGNQNEILEYLKKYFKNIRKTLNELIEKNQIPDSYLEIATKK